MPDELEEEPTEAEPKPKATPRAKPKVEPNAMSAPKAKPKAEPKPEPEFSGGVFTKYGIASAILGVVAVAAVVLGAMLWHGHRNDVDERDYQTRVLQAAAQWTDVLINMNSGTVAQSMKTLHDGTVGQLNANFEASVQPFSQVVEKLQSQTTGQVEAVAIESLYHAKPGDPGLPQPPAPELAAVSSRTDNVVVVATSVSQNVGTAPLTVHWNLRLSVSDVDGQLLVSRLENIR